MIAATVGQVVGAGLDGAAGVGLEPSSGGRVEAAAWPAMTSGATGPALADLDGAALLLQDQGRAATSAGARSTRTGAARPDSYCQHCGRRMSPGRHGRRRYCSNGCRQSAYKRRRRRSATSSG